MTNRGQLFLIVGCIVVSVGVVILAVVFFAGSGAPQGAGTATSAIDSADHTQGAASSTVSVIEYGDFECPACGAYEPTVEQLEKAYGDKVLFVFRNFPLTQIHPNAMAGAEAAEAAGLQGKYWPMHDLLFAKQNEWSLATGADVQKDLDGYATSLGLDIAKFKTDMLSDVVAAKIKADIDSANAASVDHTPTFFVNLKQIDNPAGYDPFKSVIDAALAAS